MKELLKKLLLGGINKSGAWEFDPKALGGALRTAVISALAVGAVAAMQDFDSKDWGLFDSLVASGVVMAVEFVRRVAKDYSK